MVFVSKKIIGNKQRYYFEKTLRISDGKVKKYSVYLKEYKDGMNLAGYKEKLKILIKSSLRSTLLI